LDFAFNVYNIGRKPKNKNKINADVDDHQEVEKEAMIIAYVTNHHSLLTLDTKT